MAGKYLTLLVIPDDEKEPRRLRLPVWLYRGALAFIGLVLIAPIIYIVLYYNVLAKAADADRLGEENETLRRYQYKVQVLEQSLLDTRQLMAEIAAMAGLDSVLLADMYGEDQAVASGGKAPGRASISRSLPPTSPIPDGLPATGWISRGYSDTPGKKHSGVDLAIPEGTPVYSTAFGEVIYAGWDEAYGKMVVVKNGDSIETVYGHNSELMVQKGDTIFAGQRIALSGNTGQSSAPHLHYEIRVNGREINPMKYFVYEN
ncbi:MAG: M23 family metallopeptidase [FCB group bacterium]|nr:M23 family metallopeptidase [FCB group bacterium]